MKILLFMYDSRMDSLRDKLLEAAYEIIEVNCQEDIDAAVRISNSFDGIVLPVHGVEDNGQMNMKGKLLEVDDLLHKLSEQCVIFAGVKRNYYELLTNKIIYLFSQDEVMTRNAKITAEGLLHQMIEHTDVSIFDCKVDIIGYGHVGKAIGEILTKLAIPVTVVMTRPYKNTEDINKIISSQNMQVNTLEEWKKGEPSEIVVITAPIEVIDAECSKSWKTVPLVIDMAKGRIGVNKDVIDQGKFKVIKAPALPALAAPKTAGYILAEYMISYFSCST